MGESALAPYRVIDLSGPTGWMCGRVLGDLGAEVIKIEPPGGDPARHGPDATTWIFQNQHKRSLVLDAERAEDRTRLRALLAGADAVIESLPDGPLQRWSLSVEELLDAEPQLVVTTVSPFGRTGPHAGLAASDLVLTAMCGLMWLTGDPDRAPLRLSVPQLARHAGVEAAAQTVIALHHAARTGQGQGIDVAAQTAGIRTQMNAQCFELLEHQELVRTGRYTGHSRARFQTVMPCTDGHIVVLPLGGAMGGPMMRSLFDWAREAGAEVHELVDGVDFATVDFGTCDEALFDAVSSTLADLFARFDKETIYRRAIDELILAAPINTVADLRRDEQLAARGYFQPVEIDGREVAVAGPWARLSATPLRPAAAPPHLDEAAGDGDCVQLDRRRAAGGSEATTRPFAGLHVLDLSWVGVGPMTAGYLAGHGATVIKVECSSRPDILRLTSPFKDGVAELNTSHFFANMNAGKLGLGIDLARPEGRDLIWRIIDEWADVVLESFTPKTLRGWGMDWPAIAARRPDIVMLSTCMQGQTGPRANYRGFGNLMGGLSGFSHIVGWPDRDPVLVFGAYTDFICQRYAAAALAAAIDHRRRTGAGQHIDLAQFEAAVQFLGPELLDHELIGAVAGRAGNRDPRRCPHVVLPCQPDPDGSEAWLALVCEDDAQWAALVDTLGRPAWACDPALAELAGRLAAEDRIEAELARWSVEHTAAELFDRLQPAVACGPVLRPAAVHADPQVRHRGYFVPLTHTAMGEVPYDGSAAVLSRTQARFDRAAPCLGEHSFEVLTDVLGVDAEAVAALLASGVVEITG